MLKLPAMRVGYLNILDHLMLGFAGDPVGAKLLKHTSHPMVAVSMGSWSQIGQSFSNGDLHAAFIPAPEAIMMFDSGMDIKILLSDIRLGAYLVGNRSAEVKKLIDFKGKRVLISNHLSVIYLLFYRLMASVGLKVGFEQDAEADVYIEVVPPFIAPEMVLDDSLDDIGGCFIEEPVGSMLIASGWGNVMCHSSKLWRLHPSSMFVVHDYVIQDYRRHLMDVIHLLVASSRFIYRGSNDLHRLSNSFFMQDELIIEKMFSSSLPITPVSLMPDIQALESINRFMVNDMGIMERIINIYELVDTSFALEAGA
ncbi:MAG: ABC transporter substrate-binding protein [Desulfamplus sp.]|nr:ABC transporter substrate-binding protein [Desulfamplus sp.]